MKTIRFKVWDMKKLSEKEARLVASDHFMDIVTTFGLKKAEMRLVSTFTEYDGEKVYLFEIGQE